MKKIKDNKNLLIYGLFIVLVIAIYQIYINLNFKPKVLSYTKLMEKIQTDKVKDISILPRKNKSVYIVLTHLKDKNKTVYKTNVPLSDTALSTILNNKNRKFDIKSEEDIQESIFKEIFVSVLPVLIILMILFWVLKSKIEVGGLGARGLDPSKNPAKLSKGSKTLFKDVAGLKEEKEEIKEMIDFLKYPKKFKESGARIPKGLLLFGPPGTGKTLLAKAVAGEAGVPFFYASGSDFLELYVGVGASRIRELFKQAKMFAPCLLFIDEIDTIGRKRGSGNSGGSDEREQTLNQLLSEMDGFEDSQGIIVMGATNRPDVLDHALLRPGRFDRQLTVDLPNKAERLEILKVHANNKKFEDNISLTSIAAKTPGFSGADLENVLNEAALLSVRKKRNKIATEDIEEGMDRVVGGGPAKVSKKYTEEEKKRVAYHEAGHAVVGIKLKDIDQVHKITIIPRGQAGGYTVYVPTEEKYNSTKQELLHSIMGTYGGFASESLFFDEISTGAHNDLMKLSKLARAMVTEYGMSDLGPIQYEFRSEKNYVGDDSVAKVYSSETAKAIDKEVDKILKYCFSEAKRILKENEDLVKLLADTLIEKETLNKEEIEALVNDGKLPDKIINKDIIEIKEEKLEKKGKTNHNINKKKDK